MTSNAVLTPATKLLRRLVVDTSRGLTGVSATAGRICRPSQNAKTARMPRTRPLQAGAGSGQVQARPRDANKATEASAIPLILADRFRPRIPSVSTAKVTNHPQAWLVRESIKRTETHDPGHPTDTSRRVCQPPGPLGRFCDSPAERALGVASPRHRAADWKRSVASDPLHGTPRSRSDQRTRSVDRSETSERSVIRIIPSRGYAIRPNGWRIDFDGPSNFESARDGLILEPGPQPR